METWQTVNSKNKGKKSGSKPLHGNNPSPANPPIDQKFFLSTFKTEPCPHEKNLDSHDFRTCYYYHSNKKDIRRNPYLSEYGLDESLNSYEKMYHPIIFRTCMCRNSYQCVFQDFGICSKAHHPSELKSKEDTTVEYSLSFQHKLKKTQMSDFLTQDRITNSKIVKPSREDTHLKHTAPWVDTPLSNETIVSKKILTFERDSLDWFLISSSKLFRNHLREVAFENLCQIEYQNNSWAKLRNPLMNLKGLHVDYVCTQIQAILENPPAEYFIFQEKECVSDRVMNKLNLRSNALIPKELSQSIHTNIDGSKISTCIAKTTKSGVFEEAVNQMFAKIDFWVKQERYDDFHECCSCYERRNQDEGVTCASCGSFICSVVNNNISSCLKIFVESVIPEIQGQGGQILCMSCKSTMKYQDFATHLDGETWNKLHDAIVANVVKSEYEKMQSQFDLRLEEKMAELMNMYSSSDNAVLKIKAKQNAKRARNDALNLKCPHCHTAYVDFEGCMALKCSTCNQYFCGYCHDKMRTSGGAHDHVRQCLLNETRNGSYYASKEEIKIAQRKYRTREIKKFLIQFKKEEQNATIIELEDDLKDLGIDPASLFEFGNALHDIM